MPDLTTGVAAPKLCAFNTVYPTLSPTQGLPTVTISPLYASSASIRPSRYVPLSWIALPPRDPGAIDWLYDLGYRDALFWMAKEGIEHTCSHVSRLSLISRNSSTAVANGGGTGKSCNNSGCDPLRAGLSALQDGDSSDSGSEDGDDDGDGDVSHTKEESDKVSSLPSQAEMLAATNGGKSEVESGKDDTKPRSASEPSSSLEGGAGRRDNSHERGCRSGRHHHGGGAAAAGGGGRGNKKQEERLFYVRSSFVLSKCQMRPRRERHPDLDEPRFVPSLEKFVGHGSYHAAADFAFTIFFNVVWRPAAAVLLLADLVARLLAASARAFARDLRPLLWWLTPTLLLGGGALLEEHRPSRLEGLAAALAVAAAVSLRPGAAGREDWREAGRCVRAMVEYRHVLVSTLVPWAGRRPEGGGGGCAGDGVGGGSRGKGMRSEVLDKSFMYRAVSFFM